MKNKMKVSAVTNILIMAVLVLIGITGKGQPQNKSDHKYGYNYKNNIIQSISCL